MDSYTESLTEVSTFSELTIQDFELVNQAGFGFMAVSAGLLVGFGVAWVVRMLKGT